MSSNSDKSDLEMMKYVLNLVNHHLKLCVYPYIFLSFRIDNRHDAMR